MKTSHLQREELQREEESTLVNIFGSYGFKTPKTTENI